MAMAIDFFKVIFLIMLFGKGSYFCDKLQGEINPVGSFNRNVVTECATMHFYLQRQIRVKCLACI